MIMKLFKNKNKLKGWNDVTLRQWKQIESLLKEPHDNTTSIELISVLYGDTAIDLKYADFVKKYSKALDFLSTEVPKVNLKDTYILNGRKYESNFKLTEVKTVQMVDFMNISKSNPEYERLLSVFFTPEGHQYNDGYDLQQLQNDLLELPLPVVLTASFFFIKQLELFSQIILSYLKGQMKNLTKEQQKTLNNSLKELDLNNLVSCLSYYNTAKLQMKH